MKRKVLSLVLAVAMVSSSLVACSSSGNSATSSGSSNTSDVTTETVVKEEGVTLQSLVDTSTRRTLTVEVFDRGTVDGDRTCDSNPTTDYIQEHFGELYNCDVEFVTLARSEEEDGLSMWMATKSAPDICFTYNRDLTYQFASQKGLANLTEYYEYAENLHAIVGDNVEGVSLGGEVIAVPAIRTLVAQQTPVIRQDWLDAVGMNTPTTTEEWYECMVAFKEQDPGGLGAINYPFLIKNSSTLTELNTFLWSFVNPNLSEKDDYTLPHLLLDGWSDGLRFLNEMYNEGLINPEFALDENDTLYNQAISTGAFASATDLTSVFVNGTYVKTMHSMVEDAEISIIDCFTNSDGIAMHPVTLDVGMYIIVPAASDNVDLAMAYLDWMASPEHCMRIQSGVEGEHWYWDEDGVRMTIPTSEQSEEWANRTSWTGSDWYLLTSTIYDTNEKEIARRVAAAEIGYTDIDGNENPEMALVVGQLMQDSLEVALSNPFVDIRSYAYYDTVFESVAKFQTNLDKVYKDSLVALITCKPDNFDSVYEASVKEYLSSGGQAIIDEKTEHYEANH